MFTIMFTVLNQLSPGSVMLCACFLSEACNWKPFETINFVGTTTAV